MQAIFQSESDKYLVNYVYLVAPINLALINPIGFALLEYQRARNYHLSNSPEHEGKQMERLQVIKKIGRSTLKGLIGNPLTLGIVFGIAGNFIFRQHIPHLLENLFVTLSSAFCATALFYLGWSLGGKSNKSLKGVGLFWPLILVAMKG